MIVPEENGQEAAVVKGLDVYPVASLRKVVEIINDVSNPEPLRIETELLLNDLSNYAVDFREVRGQEPHAAERRAAQGWRSHRRALAAAWP